MAAPSARERAVRRLMRIEEDRAFISRVSPEVSEKGDAREERLAAEYLAGVTRQRRRLDFHIDHFYRGEAARLEPLLRQILRVGLYDLLILETPPHAAVNESVALAKRLVNPGAGSLVNAIMRATQRAEALPEPNTGDPSEDLAISSSFPTWLVKRWREQFGEEEARAIIEVSNERPAYSLRLNTLAAPLEEHHRRLDELGAEWRPSEYLRDFVVVETLQPIVRAGWLTEGSVAVQDEAAAMIVNVLDPQPGETVLDLASAPGGKAIYSAIKMGDRGQILAVDVNARRLRLVEEAAAAHGVTIIETLAADVAKLAVSSDPPSADRVLLDAPCSGLGVLAKRADLRWRVQPDDLERLRAVQERLLGAAATMVRPGGLLVYGTCTIDRDENEGVVESFLKTHPEFKVESAKPYVPGAMVSDRDFYRALPHRDGTDGAFAARLRRG